MAKPRSKTFAELRRQLSWRLAMIEGLDAKETRFVEQQRRLEKRRQRYKAKNNGLGRPPKPVPTLSKSELRSRHVARVEAKILQHVLQCPPRIILIDWIDHLASHCAGIDEAIARKKLQSLRRQFSPQAPSPNASRAWDLEAGRAFLKTLYLHQLQRLSPFYKNPPKEAWDKALEDHERARMNVIASLFATSNLINLRHVVIHVVLLRSEPKPDKAIHDQQAYGLSWPNHVDWLQGHIKAAFVLDVP
jgi:hypothetical protein